MPSIFAGSLDDMPTAMHHRLGAFRYDVFVGRLGWHLPDADVTNVTEWDQFDRGHTVQIVSIDHAQHVCGCARLMPTTKPYLLQTLSTRSSTLELPCAPTIWELSRFAARHYDARTLCPASGMALFPSMLAVAASLGATRVIGAMTRAVARLYQRFGLGLELIQVIERADEPIYLIGAIDLGRSTFENLACDADELLRAVTWLGPHRAALPLSSTADRPLISDC
ncbi:acyl-homoserine-lactone synthase [Burkholderia arboris]|uniref:acyl-homoserine-lactone synthase n=1 Tax=Burkholderia arboris TaxID=488730 RepID=UPI001CF16AF0|nr:acyl-homoserine-lactone synthase [Burkholderia arboris]MCA8050253.1 GNAT family N-acetyltransferase [Burkholderia arboris]